MSVADMSTKKIQSGIRLTIWLIIIWV